MRPVWPCISVDRIYSTDGAPRYYRGACEPACPVNAVFAEDKMPSQRQRLIQSNADSRISNRREVTTVRRPHDYPHRLHVVPLAEQGSHHGHRLPVALHAPLRRLSGSLAALALLGCAALFMFDGVPRVLPGLAHAPVSAAPLLLIGLAYMGLQLLVRPRSMELLKRVLVGMAFLLWGVDQLLPPGRQATVLGDVVIILYVLDLALLIRDHLQREAAPLRRTPRQERGPSARAS